LVSKIPEKLFFGLKKSRKIIFWSKKFPKIIFWSKKIPKNYFLVSKIPSILELYSNEKWIFHILEYFSVRAFIQFIGLRFSFHTIPYYSILNTFNTNPDKVATVINTREADSVCELLHPPSLLHVQVVAIASGVGLKSPSEG
jgi:hypothetical protein